jgi:hypothetical protein
MDGAAAIAWLEQNRPEVAQQVRQATPAFSALPL